MTGYPTEPGPIRRFLVRAGTADQVTRWAQDRGLLVGPGRVLAMTGPQSFNRTHGMTGEGNAMVTLRSWVPDARMDSYWQLLSAKGGLEIPPDWVPPPMGYQQPLPEDPRIVPRPVGFFGWLYPRVRLRDTRSLAQYHLLVTEHPGDCGSEVICRALEDDAEWPEYADELTCCCRPMRRPWRAVPLADIPALPEDQT